MGGGGGDFRGNVSSGASLYQEILMDIRGRGKASDTDYGTTS